MATAATQSSSEAGAFSVDVRQFGYPCGPTNVHVEVSPAGSGMFQAILGTGVVGRYSFDFRVGRSGIELERAYIRGVRKPVGELPGWVTPVRKRIEEEMGL